MTAPLEGIRVLEVASWLAAPSCAALLADMGAEVIKVEPPGGDGYRKLYDSLLGADSVHPCFQFDNRGKRGFVSILNIRKAWKWSARSPKTSTSSSPISPRP